MQIGDEFVVMVETTITANNKTIENPIIRVTKSGSGNPSFRYFVDNQSVGQPRHWYVGDGNGNVVVSDVDVVDSTTSTALGTALTNQLTAAGYLSGSHTGTVSDVPDTYDYKIVLTTPPSTLADGYYSFAEETQWLIRSDAGNAYPLYQQKLGDSVARWYIFDGTNIITGTNNYPANFADTIENYIQELGYITNVIDTGMEMAQEDIPVNEIVIL